MWTLWLLQPWILEVQVKCVSNLRPSEGSVAKRGNARQSVAMRGKAWQSVAKRGNAWQSVAECVSLGFFFASCYIS